MANKTNYWKGEEELIKTPEFLKDVKNEFNEPLPLDEVFSENNFELNSNRRDFLKFFGFSVSAVALAACNKVPVKQAIPYLVKPEDVTPGVANYYNSSCGACSTSCGVQVKVREGRPIKVDGNPLSYSGKGICATGQASILSLYDTERFAGPRKGTQQVEWDVVDAEIAKALAAAKSVAIVTDTIHSPTSLNVIAKFKEKFNANHITFDNASYAGILTANKLGFNKEAIPSYYFDKAQVIVSFAADFLGTWISPVEFSKDYIKNRVPAPDKKMSRHYQFESNLSMTGTNADIRIPIKQSKEIIYLTTLYNKIAIAQNATQIPVAEQKNIAGNMLDNVAKDLVENLGKSLVISGSNDPVVQQLVNSINMLLGNYGKTIDLVNHSNQYKGIDQQFNQFVAEANNGMYDAVIFWNANPVYSYNNQESLLSALGKIKTKISLAGSPDETTDLVDYTCPGHHYLESWGDAEPKKGKYQISQPTISPVFNTRHAQESLLKWAGLLEIPETDPFAGKQIMAVKYDTAPYYTYLKNFWINEIPGVNNEADFNKVLHDGVYSVANNSTIELYDYAVIGSELASEINKVNSNSGTGIDLVLYQKTAVKDGRNSNNPWLQEMPDPVSKATWDNYLAIPKSFSETKGIKDGDVVKIKVNNIEVDRLPVLVQPGQANDTVSVAIGYGRNGKAAEKGKFEKIGKNVYPLAPSFNGTKQWVVNGVEIEKVSGTYELALTQTHHTIEGRDLLREATEAEYIDNNDAGNNMARPHMYTIWEKHEYKRDGHPGHYWAMAIDLNACTGCGSCVVACSIENNVPVVGREEVRRRREMHWIRIDRYYAFENTQHTDYLPEGDSNFEADFITKEKGLQAIDKKDAANGANFTHYENVKVIHQPVMCQHCDQAPCETVCPVLATTHSTEGLNQMTYNRCIGTKYCANNCPFKVRRFNWFRYNDNDKFDFFFNNDLGKMVINPDVTVRTRGVMEKCSMCVQRIQEGKLKAKRERRTLNDGEIEMACQRTCPTNAIVFGDLNDKESEVSKLYRNKRSYHLLEELNVQTSVKYMTKIRNI
jgi:MoCo/4Fe-4S cofactor protein with predicted Tat translocation signal